MKKVKKQLALIDKYRELQEEYKELSTNNRQLRMIMGKYHTELIKRKTIIKKLDAEIEYRKDMYSRLDDINIELNFKIKELKKLEKK